MMKQEDRCKYLIRLGENILEKGIKNSKIVASIWV